MSKFLKLVLLHSMFACLFFSCSQDEFKNSKSNDEINSYEEGTFNFFYHGKYYSGTYRMSGNSTIFSDEAARIVVDSLKNRPNLATFIHEGGLIEYFDDENDLNANLVLKSNTTRSTPTETIVRLRKYEVTKGTLVIYKDSKLRGSQATYVINNSNGLNCEVADLGGFNDEISSITLQCEYKMLPPVAFDQYPRNKAICDVTFYSDSNFKGFSVSFMVHPEYAWSEIHYFKSIKPFGPYLNGNWNDQANSFKFRTVEISLAH